MCIRDSLVKQTMARGDLTEELGYIADMERLMTRTVYGSATPKEIYTCLLYTSPEPWHRIP